MDNINYSITLNSPSAGLLLDSQIDYDKLRNEAEAYCKFSKKDLRIYRLGLYFSEDYNNKYLFKFLNLFNKIENFNNIWSEFVIYTLGDKEIGVINYCKEDKKAVAYVQNVISLHERYGDAIPKEIAEAAWSAESAVWSAERAVWSAVWSAGSAESAVWSAFWSAESAIRSAEYAESAIRGAKYAAWSAGSAIRGTERENFEALANKLTELMTARRREGND